MYGHIAGIKNSSAKEYIIFLQKIKNRMFHKTNRQKGGILIK